MTGRAAARRIAPKPPRTISVGPNEGGEQSGRLSGDLSGSPRIFPPLFGPTLVVRGTFGAVPRRRAPKIRHPT